MGGAEPFTVPEDDELPVTKEWDEQNTEAKLFIHDSATEPLSSNKLKNEGAGMVVNVPSKEEDLNPMNQFGLEEKEEPVEETILDIPPAPIAEAPISFEPPHHHSINLDDEDDEDLELEIKAVPTADATPLAAKLLQEVWVQNMMQH